MASSIELGHLRLVGEIAGEHVDAAAELGRELLELVCLAARDCNSGALLVEGAGDGAADAARGTRDQRRLVGQIEHGVPYCPEQCG